jgi:putative endonuclease
MHYFYVLYSLKDNLLYKGATSNLLQRLQQHSAGATKKALPKGAPFNQ